MMGVGPWAQQLGQEFRVHRGEGVALVDVGLLWGPGPGPSSRAESLGSTAGEGVALIDVGL